MRPVTPGIEGGWFVVVAPHVSAYPDPIRFSPGDRLVLGRRDDRYPGWLRVTTRSGHEGWAPESAIRAESGREGVALDEYTARELTASVGERVRRVREVAGWLWVESESGATGWIPKECVGGAADAAHENGPPA